MCIRDSSAGISAITTSRMIRAVDCEVCTCGAGATTSLFAINIWYFLRSEIYFYGSPPSMVWTGPVPVPPVPKASENKRQN